MVTPVLRKSLSFRVDNGKISTNGHSGQHSVRQVIIERFTPPAFLFHYPGTHARVGDSPIEEPPFKEVLKNAFEPFGKIRAAADRGLDVRYHQGFPIR